MLIISRNPGESIIIGEGKIKVVFIKKVGHQIKLAIEAPKDVVIVRKELLDRTVKKKK